MKQNNTGGLFNFFKFNRLDLLFISFLIFVVIIQIYFFKRVQYHHSPKGFTTESFENLSKNLAIYNTYSDGQYPDLPLFTFRPPMHPFLLSLCYRLTGNFYYSGMIFHNLLFILSIIIIYLTGKRFNPLVGFIASLLLFIDPISIIQSNSCQSEIPFMFFLTLSIYFLVVFIQTKKIKYSILFSICFTLSNFVRTVTLYFPFFFILLICFGYILFLKQNKLFNLKFLIIFLLIFSIPTFSWMYRNYKASGNSDFACMKAVHLYNFIAAKVYADKMGINREEARKILDKKYFNNEYNKLSDGDKEKYKIKIAKKIILDNPKEFLKNYIKSYFMLFFSYPVEFFALQYDKETYQELMKMVGQKVYTMKERFDKIKKLISNKHMSYFVYTIFIKFYYVIIMFLSFIGLFYMSFKSLKTENKQIGLFLLFLFVYIILISCTWATGRLRIQILPIMSLASAFIIWHLIWNKNELSNL